MSQRVSVVFRRRVPVCRTVTLKGEHEFRSILKRKRYDISLVDHLRDIIHIFCKENIVKCISYIIKGCIQSLVFYFALGKALIGKFCLCSSLINETEAVVPRRGGGLRSF